MFYPNKEQDKIINNIENYMEHGLENLHGVIILNLDIYTHVRIGKPKVIINPVTNEIVQLPSDPKNYNINI